MEIIRVKLVNSAGESQGCEKAPAELLKSLKEIKSKGDKSFFEFEKLNLEEIHVDLENIEEANHLIFENSKEIFEKNNKSLFIGGDHSISYSIVRAFMEVEENPLLIVFDSRSNCVEPGKYPTNKEWLRKLVDVGFNPDRIILISTRSFTNGELDFLNKNKIVIIGMDVLQEDLEGVCDLIMERARSSSGFYLSIDISCVDPAFAPGTSFLEPGGLSSREIIYLVKRLKLLDNFRGADIVEINPDKDISKMTIKLGAKILSEMI